MILNKACFKTNIDTIYYLWLDHGTGPQIAALTTSKDWVTDYESYLSDIPGIDTVREKKLPGLEKEVIDFLDGKTQTIRFRPFFLSGSGFEQRVWEEASEVPYGCTCSYGDLAAMCGRPGAARAVGNAMGKNPVMLIVPCHRIIKGDGSMGGFGSGPELKKKLLAIEGTEF